jgi:hypothetical protein
MINEDGRVGDEGWEGKIEVLGENLPQCHSAHQKSHITLPGPQQQASD